MLSLLPYKYLIFTQLSCLQVKLDCTWQNQIQTPVLSDSMTHVTSVSPYALMNLQSSVSGFLVHRERERRKFGRVIGWLRR